MKSNQKPESTPKSNRIEIIIREIETVYIQGLLIDFFTKKASPLLPVYVTYEAKRRKIDEHTIESTFSNFQIMEATASPDEPSDFLAKIFMQKYPSHAVVFIEMVKEDDQSWGKVEELTREIISRMNKLEFKISAVNPPQLIPHNLLVQEKSAIEHKTPAQHNIYVPKDEKTISKWRKAYSIMKKLDKEYLKEWEDGTADTASPEIQDYRDALTKKLSWQPSERTVRRIKAAGDDELLK